MSFYTIGLLFRDLAKEIILSYCQLSFKSQFYECSHCKINFSRHCETSFDGKNGTETACKTARRVPLSSLMAHSHLHAEQTAEELWALYRAVACYQLAKDQGICAIRDDLL